MNNNKFFWDKIVSMENLQKTLDELVDKISYLELKRLKIGQFMKEINSSMKIGPNEEIKDEKIINKVPSYENKRTSVLGIDGGIIKQSYHGLDLMLTRAVGVNFIYSDGKLDNVFYYPNSNPTPNPIVIFDSFSELELSSCYNFERQTMEVLTAIESTEKFKPDIVLLHGSIIPHYVPKPDNLILKEYYKTLIETYRSLFELCKSKNFILAGVVEDSRGVKFCDILNRRILSQVRPGIDKEMKLVLEKTKDSNLLYYVLDKGERTCTFNYSQNPEIHPVLKEFSDMNELFFSFYLKTADFDRPLRVDFLCSHDLQDVVDKLSTVMMQTSGHSGYGLPAVLIEADQRAKLSENDMNMFYSDLINRVGNVSTLFRLRREMRPF
jgi:hypothetical protein